MTGRQELPAWQALQQHADDMKQQHLFELFAKDDKRFERLHLQFGGLSFDFSKQRVTEDTLTRLSALADACHLMAERKALFVGDKVNTSEGRAARHWALRLPLDRGDSEVNAELEHMERLVSRIRSGQWRGVRGDAITDVVNIGVGGSDIGPLMVSYALRDSLVQGASSQTAVEADLAPLRVHFASSMDGSQMEQIQQRLNPGTTLFIVSSKSFSTADTMHNANTARHWLMAHLGDETAVMRCHFIGVSACPEKMTAWGIPKDNQLLLWDWVGGRFSLWSVVGLSIALTIGMAGFRELLAGAHAMDEHFRSQPWRHNLPVILALLQVWNVNFLGIKAHTFLPYDGRLRYLPAYFEQLEMESNGKSVSRTGEPLAYDTSPVIWGEVGSNAQHAFYQLLHQGTQPVACDFIVPAHRYHQAPVQDAELLRQHRLALANSLAQSRLLAFGNAALAEIPKEAWRRYPGNQPSNFLLLDELNAGNLGSLLALYEHKVFVAAVIWDINPFDQWGVEMGKRIADELLPQITGDEALADHLDTSTQGLLTLIVSNGK
jgi:glucose-6-phosphate isomerase